ncbi:MAG: acyl-CoA carboxylase subunit beta [Deltaproteobacteria bacterium]|nr:acyl-CoA carboxylase subunit beta [Deltaproteobacteria bacterium]
MERVDVRTLLENRAKTFAGGGVEGQKEQHARGKLTARERLQMLFDEGSFVETDAFMVHDCKDFGMDRKHVFGDGVVTGWGNVEGRMVYAFAQDFTTFGGSLSKAVAEKICKLYKLAIQNGAPMLGLNDSGGARIHEGVASLAGYADIFYLNVQASGVIPQLSLILGPCAGGAVYSPAMTDFTFMVEETSHMFITGPNVVKAVTGEEVSFEDLGGARTHATKSGVSDRRFASEEDIFVGVKRLLSYLPSNNMDDPPLAQDPAKSEDAVVTERLIENKQRIDTLIPENANESYDMKEVINCLVDPDSFWELKGEFAPNMVTGFARLGGYSIGVVGNNPQHMAGAIDINASVKGARFVRFCDCFNIPILTMVDVPGFYPGRDQEEGGIIRHGAKILYAYCEATVPRLTVISRKAYGGAYIVMGAKHIGGDINVAWPSAEIAVMGAAAACKIIFKKEIEFAKDSEAEEKKQTELYAKKFATPYVAAAKGYIDAVLLPSETRDYLLRGLKSCLTKRVNLPKRKHGNIPL